MIDKITWTLFNAKLEEKIDISPTKDREDYSVSDLVLEVFYVTALKEIYESTESNVNYSPANMQKKLNELYELLNQFMERAKSECIKINNSFIILNKLSKNAQLEKIVIDYYKLLTTTDLQKDETQEQSIIENIKDKNNREQIKSIFQKSLNKNYEALNESLRFMGELYKKRYEIYELLEKLPKIPKNELNYQDLYKIILSDSFDEYSKNQIKKIKDFYEEKQKELCSINIVLDSNTPIEDIKNYIRKTPPLQTPNFSKRCFALADAKINGTKREIIAFSGVFDAGNISKLFDEYKDLSDAIDNLLTSTRFKNSELIKTELDTRYYYNDKDFIELKDVINFVKNKELVRQLIGELKRMFSCCEKKMLKDNISIEKLYVKFEPCDACNRALLANKVTNNIFYGQNYKTNKHEINMIQIAEGIKNKTMSVEEMCDFVKLMNF